MLFIRLKVTRQFMARFYSCAVVSSDPEVQDI